MGKKKQKVAVCGLLAAMLITNIIWGHPVIADAAEITNAVTAAAPVAAVNTYYLKSTQELIVRAQPSEAAEEIATAAVGTIFIVSGETSDGWCQVYYLGKQRYIKNEGVTEYAGGAKETPLPVITYGDTETPLTINFLGDSITYGDKLTDRSRSFSSLLSAWTEANGNNYGLNGSCMAGFHPDRFIDRYQDMGDADVIIVAGGTNDYEFNTGLATMGDVRDTTFYGMLNQLMCGLKQKYPHAQIIFLTPLRRNYDTRENEKGRTLENYANAIINMGAFYDIPVVDLYHTQSLNFKGTRYLADGLHPTAAGHRRIANYLFHLLFTEEEETP